MDRVIDLYDKEQMKKKSKTDKYKLTRLKQEIDRIRELREIGKEDVMNLMNKFEVGLHDLTFIFNQLGIKLTGIMKEK